MTVLGIKTLVEEKKPVKYVHLVNLTKPEFDLVVLPMLRTAGYTEDHSMCRFLPPHEAH